MMTTRRAAIVAPMRTPVGAFGGSLRAVLLNCARCEYTTAGGDGARL